ncbi:MAG: threonine--tRNA ligase [Chloroflexi bacterium]|nr:threonine--tRNA ligase [Chloroflexota bacterium]MCY3938788.1 threonine--tRNA ligase [Chloroflexota bacterium]
MTMSELETMRHSCAHVMAAAVIEMFPEASLGFGPPIDDGFYYDFDLARSLTPDDLEEIERRMRRLISRADPFEYEELEAGDAKALLGGMGQNYKIEAIDDISRLGEAPSIYRSGDFLDLCAGPHLEHTGKVGPFKLLSIAGAYWKGSEKNPQLQRIYGTCFPTQAELDRHLELLEEARSRDHRTLGLVLDLFTVNELVGPGLALWHPNGGRVREIIEDFWRAEHRRRGYELVFSPHIGRAELWDTSGHTRWFADDMFPPMELETQSYVNKPMNCPFHIQIYKSRTRSYRELPLRWGELGTVYRHERSGVLHGMLRARGFTQDDAHLFLRPDQLVDEILGVLDLELFFLKQFGYEDLRFTLSVRDESNKEHYAGTDEVWELAERALANALNEKELEYTRAEGEATFYGPKIDTHLSDALGRLWQGPTIQVDFNLPERFDIVYEGQDGVRHRPVMVHRTILGSMERFVAGLVEHHAGAFPVWLAPEQVRVINIADRHVDYCQYVVAALREAGLRAQLDVRSERMNLKIRRAQWQKTPYMLIAGDRDVAAEKVSVRLRSGQDLGAMDLADFIETAVRVNAERAAGYGFDE